MNFKYLVFPKAFSILLMLSALFSRVIGEFGTACFKTGRNLMTSTISMRKSEEKWKNIILPPLKVYKQLNGDLLIPTAFVVPSGAPWPVESYNLKLGSIVDTIRNKSTWKKYHSELLDLGFDFRSALDITWQDQILPCLKQYHAMHGNFNVPQCYIIPNELSWPAKFRGLQLGNIVMGIRCMNAWQSKHKELESIGFDTNSSFELRWTQQIYPAFLSYKSIHGHLDLKKNFIVPENCTDFPQASWGLRLGHIAEAIRNRGHWREKKHMLIALGFRFQNANEMRWRTKILPALETYQFIHGDLLVPAKFVIPPEIPWPQKTHGLKLGNIVSHIRNMGEWSEKHEELENLGFLFGDFLEKSWENEIYPAFKVYEKIFGNFNIPVSFIVPDEPPWPPGTHGLKLGVIVNTIRNQGIHKNKVFSDLQFEFIQGTFIDWIQGTRIEDWRDMKD